MSPTSGIYWVELGFINNFKEPQLWLVLLRYSTDVASAFPWVVTRRDPAQVHQIRKNPSWMDPIKNFLQDNTLPEGKLEAEKIRRNAPRF